MRILYHHRTLGDGAEGIHIAEMVSAFRSLGHDVHVRGLAAQSGSGGRTAFARRVKRALPRVAFEVASLAGNTAEYLDVQRAIRTFRPDFLYKRHARLDIGALAAARRAGVPTVLEVNCLFTGTDYHRFEPTTLRTTAVRLEQRALMMSDIVLAVSSPLAASIERVGSVQPVVMPNGVDPERFDPARVNGTHVRSRLGLQGALTVGWAGVMREWHRLELLIEALALAPDARLLILGDGPARGNVERLAASGALRGRVVITGRVDPSQMPEYIAAMDVAVVAGDGTGVASPMKLLEYMAMERPVVAPALDNIRDLVTDGSDGLLFGAGDADDLAKQLRRLSSDEELRRQLGRQARRTVLARRNWRCNAERVLALVSERVHTRLGGNLGRVWPGPRG